MSSNSNTSCFVPALLRSLCSDWCVLSDFVAHQTERRLLHCIHCSLWICVCLCIFLTSIYLIYFTLGRFATLDPRKKIVTYFRWGCEQARQRNAFGPQMSPKQWPSAATPPPYTIDGQLTKTSNLETTLKGVEISCKCTELNELQANIKHPNGSLLWMLLYLLDIPTA